jgi:hypothetical protein
LRDVQSRLKPVEPETNKRPVHESVAYGVELGAQQPKEQQHSQRLGTFLGNRRRNRCRQHHCGIRAEHLSDRLVLLDPRVD